MHVLTISDGVTSVVFPKTRKISHGGELSGKETTMSDGTLVFDAIGFRKSITYEYDYLPQSVFDVLIPMLRGHRYVTATYLDLDNVEKTASFNVAYPTAQAFKITPDGGAVWHKVTINLTAKKVETK